MAKIHKKVHTRKGTDNLSDDFSDFLENQRARRLKIEGFPNGKPSLFTNY
jgi:hypothetical protein